MKKQKITYHSFTENNQKFMQCKQCYQYTETSDDSVAVTCSTCTTVINITKYPDSLPKTFQPSGRPPGWHFMTEFVDKDGNVFHKGTEQTELKGTLKPTKIKPKKKKTMKKKLSADDKLLKDISDYKKKQKLKRKQEKVKK